MLNRGLLILTLLPCIISVGLTNPDSSRTIPVIHSGAIAIGVSGSLTIIEDLANASLLTRTRLFKNLGERTLLGIGVDASYSHIRSLDEIGIQGNFSCHLLPSNIYLIPFVAIGGGFRQEFIGSFQQVRYPIGFDVGATTMVAQQAGFQLEYSFRRILNDPVSNFTEHHILIGITVFFRNIPEP